MYQFTNTYEKDKGSVKIRKTFAGAELTEQQKDGLEFTITKPDKTTQTVTYADFTAVSYDFAVIVLKKPRDDDRSIKSA